MQKSRTTMPVMPWWRVPMVWMVISGPALVVVASVVTAVFAWRGGDEPLRDVAEPQTRSQPTSTMAPATQARNHAATAR